MPPFGSIGKMLIIFGAVLIGIGLLITIAPRISWIGRLPGDFFIQRRNFSFYFLLGTSILISIIPTLIFTLFFRR